VNHETYEELEFRDRVVEMALDYGNLVVATSTQCHIYSVNNLNTPHIMDLRGRGGGMISLILMSGRKGGRTVVVAMVGLVIVTAVIVLEIVAV